MDFMTREDRARLEEQKAAFRADPPPFGERIAELRKLCGDEQAADDEKVLGAVENHGPCVGEDCDGGCCRPKNIADELNKKIGDDRQGPEEMAATRTWEEHVEATRLAVRAQYTGENCDAIDELCAQLVNRPKTIVEELEGPLVSDIKGADTDFGDDLIVKLAILGSKKSGKVLECKPVRMSPLQPKGFLFTKRQLRTILKDMKSPQERVLISVAFLHPDKMPAGVTIDDPDKDKAGGE